MTARFGNLWARKATGHDRGFGLIELLVVVAILALLAAIGLPQFVAYRSRAVDTEMKSDLKNAAAAMESYFAEYRVYPATVAAITAVGFRQSRGVTLTIAITTPGHYTLTAAKPAGSQPSFTYDSATGLIH